MTTEHFKRDPFPFGGRDLSFLQTLSPAFLLNWTRKQSITLMPPCCKSVRYKCLLPLTVCAGNQSKKRVFYWQTSSFLRAILLGTLKLTVAPCGPASFPIVCFSKNERKSWQGGSRYCCQSYRGRWVRLFCFTRQLTVAVLRNLCVEGTVLCSLF